MKLRNRKATMRIAAFLLSCGIVYSGGAVPVMAETLPTLSEEGAQVPDTSAIEVEDDGALAHSDEMVERVTQSNSMLRWARTV